MIGIVAIAGVGGVLFSDEARRMHLGGKLMQRPERPMSDEGGVAFGCLGCREQIVPFLPGVWLDADCTPRTLDRA